MLADLFRFLKQPLPAVLAAFVWMSPASLSSPEAPFIRVLILKEAPSIRVTVEKPCQLKDLATGQVLAQWKHLRWKQVKPISNGIALAGEAFPVKAVLLEPTEPALLRVNARPYRSSLILRVENQKLMVINRLGLEEYLVGALTSETSPKWPMEALKAHAIASRTMVAHRIWVSKKKPFDVTADTQTHLYYGVKAERRRTREAVQATAGQVLAYNKELFSATFHANCGGHTEDAAELWQVKGKLPPLEGVVDPYCKNLRHYRWNTRMSQSEFVKRLGSRGQSLGSLTAVEVGQRNRSGRVRSVRLVGKKGELELTGKELRNLLGVNRLRSLNFTVQLAGGGLNFSGLGWGHGVGFCQWGAYGMSRANKKAEEILALYFPQAQLRRLKGLPGFS